MNRFLIFSVLTCFAFLSAFSHCVCSGSSSTISFGGIGNVSNVLHKKQWLTEFHSDYRTLTYQNSSNESFSHLHESNETSHDEFLSSSNKLTTMFLGIGGMRYGVTDRITFSIQQPLVRINATGQRIQGVGDLMVMGTAELVNKNGFSMAITGGVELPSGIKSSLSEENYSVIGTGSFDPVVGLSAIKSWNRNFIRATGFYKYTTEGFDNTNFGSLFSYNLTYSYNLKEQDLSCGSDSLKAKKSAVSWNAFIGFTGEWYGKQIQNNTIIDNTGGNLMLTSVGTQFGYKKWIIPISFTIPIEQNLRGNQSITQFRVKVGVVKLF